MWSRKRKEIVVVNNALPFEYGKERLVAKLYKPEAEVIRVTTLRELNETVNRYYDKAIELAHRRISAEHDALVYESYGDVALPWKGIKDLDLVLAVHPGYIQAYDPDKYFSALNLSTKLWREQKTGNIVDLLKPVKTVRVPPYKSEVIIKKLKRKLHLFAEASA